MCKALCGGWSPWELNANQTSTSTSTLKATAAPWLRRCFAETQQEDGERGKNRCTLPEVRWYLLLFIIAASLSSWNCLSKLVANIRNKCIVNRCVFGTWKWVKYEKKKFCWFQTQDLGHSVSGYSWAFKLKCDLHVNRSTHLENTNWQKKWNVRKMKKENLTWQESTCREMSRVLLILKNPVTLPNVACPVKTDIPWQPWLQPN